MIRIKTKVIQLNRSVTLFNHNVNYDFIIDANSEYFVVGTNMIKATIVNFKTDALFFQETNSYTKEIIYKSFGLPNNLYQNKKIIPTDYYKSFSKVNQDKNIEVKYGNYNIYEPHYIFKNLLI